MSGTTGLFRRPARRCWVTLDSNATLDWLRVEGGLSILGGVLGISTIVGTADSHLTFRAGTVEFSGQVNDPFAFSVGMIWHGSADIHGAEKSPYSFAVGELAAGQQTIEVADGSGWQVGDKLVVAGTSLDYRVNQDDVRHVAAVDGNTVTLDSPLAFAHVLVDGHPPVIENLTRSVTFRTADGSPDRGHVMFMHNPDVDISYAAFEGLGRTDKTRDFTIPDGQGGGLENPNGRYSLHFHRTGYSYDSQQASVVGVAIDGSPGWGLTNHESYVNVYNSVAYNVVGASFVTETGNEQGTFTRDVAVRGIGRGSPRDAITMARTTAGGLNDGGKDGTGFWIESPLVSVADCISAGQLSAGIFVDSNTPKPLFADSFSAESWAAIKPVQAWKHYVSSGGVPVTITGNLLYGSATPLQLWATGDVEPRGYSAISGNTVIASPGGNGLMLGYCDNLRITDNRIIGSSWTGTGVAHTDRNRSMIYVDNAVVGFGTGIDMPTAGINSLKGGFYDNAKENLFIATMDIRSPTTTRSIVMSGLEFGDTSILDVRTKLDSSFSMSLNYFYGLPYYQPHDIAPLFTNKAVGPDSLVLDGVNLYFEEQGADFEFGRRLVNAPADLRYNPDGSFTTTADLAERGLIVGGVPLPAGVQYHLEKVRGVFVGA